MENKNSAFKEFISPILVLVIICFVVTFLLAFTYGITAPIIEKNTEAAASEARSALLEAADGKFSDSGADLVVYEEGKVYAVDCYTADNGEGMVVTVKSNSYGGLLTAMVGIDKNGAITGVQVTEHADTPGVGTKAQDPGHLSQYIGHDELGSDNIKAHADDIVEVTGASVSSGAIHKAVYCALEQFKAMGGVK
ncbi:MAG: FMN-binding protein [Clostridiales bacterium]|jgi:electron transport complex protein RnfG|nr:FMN-binding protein [Clostridiales bacterium]